MSGERLIYILKNLLIFSIICLCFPLQASLSAIRHIYLTWNEETTHDNIAITAHTTKFLDHLEVFYDTQKRDGNIKSYRFSQKVKGKIPFIKSADREIFSFFLKDLQEDTKYYFIVGHPDIGYSQEKAFCTMAKNPQSLRIIEGGDWELTEKAKTLAEIAICYDPQVIWLGGDYPRNISGLEDYEKWDEWLDVYESTMISSNGCLIPLVMAIGNHEVIGGYNQHKANSPFYFRYFPQNEKTNSYFLKHFGEDIVLFVLDSGHIASHEGEQSQWLKENLEKYKNLPIKLAMYHVPIYPSVRFVEENLYYRFFYWLLSFTGKNEDSSHLLSVPSQEGKKTWLPLFDKYKITTAFEHHDQTLKRTRLLRNNKVDLDGTLYLGDGGWGAEIQVPPIQTYFSPLFAKSMGYVSFFWLIDIKEDKITYQAISAKGHVLDEYMQKIKTER